MPPKPKKKRSRLILIVIFVLVLAGGLALAFWPRALLVDIGVATTGPMQVTLDNEGRTRVRNTYVVSAPTDGRILRIGLEPGDQVTRGETVVAQMLPISPTVLDARTREQATALVTAAQAALRVAEADLAKVTADAELAAADLGRARRLNEGGIVSQAALDQAERAARAADAAIETAAAAIAIRNAELQSARARLIGFDDPDYGLTHNGESDAIPLPAPISGVVLQVMQQNETTIGVGTPLLEIGDIVGELEVIVSLLSSDAVQVRPGQRAIIDDWGGPAVLVGEVIRIAPWGETRHSALGVEEQRVDVTIRFLSPPDARAGLGHGYRVEARIITWESENALQVPTSALFRDGAQWQVFVVSDGVARQRTVSVGANNGIEAQIIDGLSRDEAIVIYPPPELQDGARVRQRQADGLAQG
ncbi:MAG: HlyD family efflux transporter periplasmic adaptor subunit [Paracoccaceae bacterium]